MLQEVLTKKSKACRVAGCRTLSARTFSRERTQELHGIADQPGMAPETADPGRAGLFANENQGNRLCTKAIRVSTNSRPVVAGRMEKQS